MVKAVKYAYVVAVLATTVLVGCGGSSNVDASNTTAAMQRTTQGAVVPATQTDVSGDNVVTIAGYRANYTIVKDQQTGVVTLTNNINNAKSTYSNPTLIKFSDKWTSFDIEGAAGQVYRLYQAAYNRKPDLAGLGYWISANEKGSNLQEIAGWFINSAEFKNIYGSNVSAIAFVNGLYQNVLHRPGDLAGVAYWVDVVSQGADRREVLFAFSRGKENKDNTYQDVMNGFDYSPLGVPIRALSTSYANAKQAGFDRLTLPNEMSWSLAYARADFKGNGKVMLFATLPTYNMATMTEQNATPGKFAFWSQTVDGSWIREPSMIDTPLGCIHPRKAVVADFNHDGTPDVLVACHGYDGGTFPGEKMWLVLSSKTGVFHSAPLQDFVGFFHSVSAADLNGDGYVDFVAADVHSPNALRTFINKGDGTFFEVFGQIPLIAQKRSYFTVELVDVNGDGKIDLLAGGHDWGSSPTIYALGDGTAGFSNSKVFELPSVADHGVVLDFLVANGSIYIDRTSGGGVLGFYQSKVIQKVNMATMNSTVPFIKNISKPDAGESFTWFPWLLQTSQGIQSDNAHVVTSVVN